MTAPEGVEAHFIVAVSTSFPSYGILLPMKVDFSLYLCAHFDAYYQACENMISGKAVVPSDILTASNGKTIEVMNTDVSFAC